MRPPDFIGIGFRRCATSWLRTCLSEHPDIGIPLMGVHYFSENFDNGWDWYLQQFHTFADKRVIIDFSVSYSYPENIQKFVDYMPTSLPKTKLFALVRNPIERAFSDYRRSLYKQEFSGDVTFGQALEQCPLLLERGHYKQILQKIFDITPANNVKLILYNDIQDHPDLVWKDICRYLDVSDDFRPSLLTTSINHLAAPKSQLINNILRKSSKRLTNLPLVGKHWQALKNTALWHKTASLTVGKVENIEKNIYQKLVDYYYEDIRFVENLTERDLSGWLND